MSPVTPCFGFHVKWRDKISRTGWSVLSLTSSTLLFSRRPLAMRNDFPINSWGALLTAALSCIVVFSIKLHKARRLVRNLQKQGLSMPPHSYLFGHIPLLVSIVASLPPRAYGLYVSDSIRKRYPYLDTAFYLDIWPFGPLMLVVLKPDMMYQLTQANQLPKDASMRKFLEPLTGKEDLATMNGEEWKKWRRLFNPGFSSKQIAGLFPVIVEKVRIFTVLLEKKAQTGEVFRLDDMAVNLTIDIIGEVVILYPVVPGSNQSQHHDICLALTVELEIFPNPARPFVHWYNTYLMDNYLTSQLHSRYASTFHGKETLGKSVIDLALQSYLKDNSTKSGDSLALPKAFQQAALSQTKLFIFAGHDTTSSTVVFTLSLLYLNPTDLSLLRAEHNSILGPSSTLERTLSESPTLIKDLPYTLAVIKETLRIYPPVSALRTGAPEVTLVDKDSNKQYPTAGCTILGDHYALHHNPAIFPRPEEFLPECWLVGKGHALYPPEHAWRPFEKGPRSCLGKDLALLEIATVLAFVVRRFEIQECYGRVFGVLEGVGERRAYMAGVGGGGHPAEGFPCTVRVLE
ncbi:cytochrome P450 [Corynespora cassiicola Philippines]|uniref:Cytochrome P450 n=1 Tax=Corynespora cassiicola Philippines TaxID=1448308 RepID=A0A2T2NVD9_CORCC|nr:cytochrome P450 [Corynespora cassiicola Philippines]